MLVREGTDVYTADGQKVGSVQRVVMNPETQEVSHLVVEKGVLFVEDKVVPVEWVQSADDDRIVLGPTEQDFDDLPVFEETYYIAAPGGRDMPPEADMPLARPYYWNPPVGTAWWGYPGYGAYLNDYFVAATERNIPEGTIALKKGSRIVSADGDHVGDVEEFFVDDETDRATHLLISEGLLFKKKRVIPTYWIASADDDEIRLAVNADVVDAVPEYVR